MSDPKSSLGEPVDEPTAVDDDVVGRANEGLADAEAARVSPEPVEPAQPAEPAEWSTKDAASADEAVVPVRDTPAETWDAAPATVAEPVAAEPVAAEPVVAQPVVAEPVVTASEPVVADTAVVAPAAATAAAASPQPIFVQAPEAPNPRGNRAAAGAIGLLAALSFAALYLGAWLGFGLLLGDLTDETVGTAATDALGSWSLWVPVAVFFLAFWLLGAIINRGRWGYWVVFGLLVGVAAYGGHILGQLFEAQFWTLTASEGAALTESQLLAPLAIAAFVIGRELTIWFGSWVASRGKKVSELNYEAQREYERTLEAGPTLVRQ